MPLAVGARLGAYEIIAPLGVGGMGEVYRARDERLKRDIAIKVLPDDVASSPDRLARLEREATTVAALNHPNIVMLHSVEDVAGTRFLTMELVEGESLASLVSPEGLPLSQLLDLAIPLADALVAAHEKGIVHRDLKPANVMVTRDGRVKVLDFGLAKPAQAEPDLEKTHVAALAAPGEVVGTAPYMAPEQIRGSAEDARTDLFSFGVLVFELASGRRPFAGPTLADVTSAILRDKPPSLTRFRPDLPADLERIVGRCLEKRPGDRFQSALDVANELRGLKRALDRGGVPPPSPSPDHVASIAVLPFVNRSASADDEYFCDGLADELLHMLATIKGLRVAARTSAFYFKGKETTIAEIGQALNVATVLEGSVRKAGQRVRISVQLVKVSDGYQLWSETYDRTLEDIFAVQDEVARAVAAALPGKLLSPQAGPATGRGTNNSDAYDAFLEGRFYWNKRTEADAKKTIEFFERAIRIDAGYAEAWAGLADCYVTLSFYSLIPTSETLPKAREAAQRALTLRPELGAAHATLAYAGVIDFRWAEAEPRYRRAIELSPEDATAHVWYSDLLMMTGRMNAALRQIRRAIELDPLSARMWAQLAEWHWFEGQLDEAMADFRKALELTPTMPLALELAARLCWQRGDAEQYFSLRTRLEAVSARVAVSTQELREAYTRGGRNEVLRAQLAAPVARQLSTDRARWHAELGDLDAAFQDLDDALAQREIRLPYVTYFADFAPLWKDPRFHGLLVRVGVR
jgi:serine/threonine protein kinase/tetratricopeptide (TPR) repeat protein